MKKPNKRWGVNVVLFILGLFLSVSGLLNAWVLPHGYEARGSALVTLRHFLTECHTWAGLFFIAAVGTHLLLHNSYLRKNFATFGWSRWFKG